MGNSIADTLFHEAEPLVAEMGLELVDVEFAKEGANWYLRFFIDKDPMIEVDDCALVSERLSDWLDEKDPINQAYFLEVSSPGIERSLRRQKDFQRFEGSMVHIKMFSPWNGKKELEGLLSTVDENVLRIADPTGQVLEIPRANISKVHLVWKDN